MWDYYRVKLYKIGYTEVAVPEGEPPAETVIGYTEVFSKTVNKWHKNKIPTNDPDKVEMRVDVTPAILKHGEGDYVATLQGLVYADLTADEINSLGAVAPLEETRASSEPSEYSEIYEEIYYAPPVPILDDKNDKWTLS